MTDDAPTSEPASAASEPASAAPAEPPSDPRNLDNGPVFVVPDIKFDEVPDIPSVGIRKGYGLGEVGNGGPTGPTGPEPGKGSNADKGSDARPTGPTTSPEPDKGSKD